MSAFMGEVLTPQLLDQAMKMMDADGNEEVDFDEFVSWWESEDRSLPPLIRKAHQAIRTASREAAARDAADLTEQLTKEEHHYVAQAKKRRLDLMTAIHQAEMEAVAARDSKDKLAKAKAEEARLLRVKQMAGQMEEAVEAKRHDHETWTRTLCPSAAGTLASQGSWIGVDPGDSNATVVMFRSAMAVHGAVARADTDAVQAVLTEELQRLAADAEKENEWAPAGGDDTAEGEASLLNSRGMYGFAAMHWAACLGRPEGYRAAQTMTRCLLEKGSDVNGRNDEGCTALHLAAAHGDGPLLALLLAKGADHSAVDGKKRTALHVAAEAGHDHVLRNLVRAGCLIDAKDSDGLCTPLHLAARAGRAAAVRSLIRLVQEDTEVVGGVEPTGWLRVTPVQMAAESGHAEVVEILLQAAADVAQKDEYFEETPLHKAAGGGHTDTVAVLLRNGARPLLEAKTAAGETPLHKAAAAGHAETAVHLIDSGAALDAVVGSRRYGRTAREVAAASGHTAVVTAIEVYLREMEAKKKAEAARREGDARAATLLRGAMVEGMGALQQVATRDISTLFSNERHEEERAERMREQAKRQFQMGKHLYEEGVEPGDEHYLGAVEAFRTAVRLAPDEPSYLEWEEKALEMVK